MQKTKISQYLIMLLLSTMLFSACTKNLTQVITVYENDFNDGTLKGIETLGWQANGLFGAFPYAKITTYQNNKMLGELNNSLVFLKFSSLPQHDNIKIEFDLYVHDNWRNNLWKMQFDGQDQIITGFSNDSTVKQDYPNWLNTGNASPAGNQAQEIYLPGTCSLKNSARGTSRYKIMSSIAHTIDSLSITLSDAGGALNDTCARSWSIDNVKIVTLKN